MTEKDAMNLCGAVIYIGAVNRGLYPDKNLPAAITLINEVCDTTYGPSESIRAADHALQTLNSYLEALL